MRYLVTGGAGFIGSHFVKLLLRQENVTRVVNLDKLTYAGNLKTLEPIAKDPRYSFVQGDIADSEKVREIVKSGIDVIVNFAAETHVDRSIQDASTFLITDMQGVYVLLEACREFGIERFLQVSTDEVYGSIATGAATENSPLLPSNPYSASKSGGDRLAYSYYVTYDLPVIITRASNNYGPYQYPEKLIPLFITNALTQKKLPLYGDGLQTRDWIHAEDHCEAIWLLLEKGKLGEVYNIAGGNEWTNLKITETIMNTLKCPEDIIQRVTDRPGHDRRYAMNADKLRALGWQPQHTFEQGLQETIAWYQEREDWWGPIKSGEFKKYYQKQYGL